MTSPSAYIREENEKLRKMARKIKKIPYCFRGIGEIVDLKKVMQVINNYGN